MELSIEESIGEMQPTVVCAKKRFVFGEIFSLPACSWCEKHFWRRKQKKDTGRSLSGKTIYIEFKNHFLNKEDIVFGESKIIRSNFLPEFLDNLRNVSCYTWIQKGEISENKKYMSENTRGCQKNACGDNNI